LLTKEVLPQVSAKETTTAVWDALEVIFASRTRAHAVNTSLALAIAQKGNQSVAEYVGKMHSLGDEMEATGRKLDDAELVEYILSGLDYDFNPIISALGARTEPVSVDELYSQLLVFGTRMELVTGGGNNSGSSANMANRGGRGGGRGGGHSSGRGGFGRSNGGHDNDNTNTNTNTNNQAPGRAQQQQSSATWWQHQLLLFTTPVPGLLENRAHC
jgi:uncharacterized membrane protein YgcG